MTSIMSHALLLALCGIHSNVTSVRQMQFRRVAPLGDEVRPALSAALRNELQKVADHIIFCERCWKELLKGVSQIGKWKDACAFGTGRILRKRCQGMTDPFTHRHGKLGDYHGRADGGDGIMDEDPTLRHRHSATSGLVLCPTPMAEVSEDEQNNEPESGI